ncbi:hypothetical protein WN51_10861 [Melipona quadrifasciata]|uniref:Uncharacterized protein n=1 Tax=Melipona quadrifasciata TaxID=166423 RepID=A0A0M9A4U2_9HYME|nr:hypothetical protein WN51_10861 [Melipona quadrifasciata]
MVEIIESAQSMREFRKFLNGNVVLENGEIFVGSEGMEKMHELGEQSVKYTGATCQNSWNCFKVGEMALYVTKNYLINDATLVLIYLWTRTFYSPVVGKFV